MTTEDKPTKPQADSPAKAKPNPTTKQDTPGRANSSSSRQQTHPEQAEQTGTPHIDADSKDTAKPKRQEDLASLPTRPAKD